MEIYQPLTEKRSTETYDQYYKRDAAAKEAKAQWQRDQVLNDAFNLPRKPEPAWNSWNPPPLIQPPPSNLPIAQTPSWLQNRLMDLPFQAPPELKDIPPSSKASSIFDIKPEMSLVFDDQVPSSPVLVHSTGNVEILGLKRQDITDALKRGGKLVAKGTTKVWAPVRVGYYIHKFITWNDQLLPEHKTKPVRTQYDFASNRVLYEHRDGQWRDYPPPGTDKIKLGT